MKYFLRIKRTMIFPDQSVIILLRSGHTVGLNGKHYINNATGEVLEPLYDEHTDELVGFAGHI